MKNQTREIMILSSESNKLIITLSVFIALTFNTYSQSFKKISQDDLRDKISGYWIGQCVGNYMGFPFEGTYEEEPVPVFVDRYYQFDDDSTLSINRKDLRGYCLLMTNWLEGAFSDDDTDIEFVTLHAVEKYGLDITYPEITEMWKKHINRKIWCANRTARNLMEKGFVAPETGSKKNNENWYQIDPQLVNEIWSMLYPGMTSKSAEKAEWGARITNDDWGVHPTIAYGVMYSAAVFEKDVEKLVDLALSHIPEDSPFYEGMKDVISWYKQNTDWRVTRKFIFDKYYRYTKGDYSAPVSDVSSLANGLFGIMAILYGEGDFVKTTGIAVSAGLDCDNQAATCAGLIGVINGGSSIPSKFTLGLGDKPSWKVPFNDTYINYTRDDLPPYTRISDIVNRILILAEESILANGGRKITENNKTFYLINSDI
ncbi:MAG TPA: ADP-ribosylglycohydrolase family protein [Bacteroidales bacterium]|nr:ADP-ribosylglycohydrolase family protein [Bacteroidales bacterium]